MYAGRGGNLLLLATPKSIPDHKRDEYGLPSDRGGIKMEISRYLLLGLKLRDVSTERYDVSDMISAIH